jgi:hypothetical protein
MTDLYIRIANALGIDPDTVSVDELVQRVARLTAERNLARFVVKQVNKNCADFAEALGLDRDSDGVAIIEAARALRAAPAQWPEEWRFRGRRDLRELDKAVKNVTALLDSWRAPTVGDAQRRLMPQRPQPVSQPVSQEHTGKRVRYEFGNERWDAWLVVGGAQVQDHQQVEDRQAIVKRDNGEHWTVMTKDLTLIDPPAATADTSPVVPTKRSQDFTLEELSLSEAERAKVLSQGDTPTQWCGCAHFGPCGPQWCPAGPAKEETDV